MWGGLWRGVSEGMGTLCEGSPMCSGLWRWRCWHGRGKSANPAYPGALPSLMHLGLPMGSLVGGKVVASSMLTFHQLAVAEPQSNVRGHHDGVDAVQDDDGVIAVEQLVGDAGSIADENDAEKLEAFSCVVP